MCRLCKKDFHGENNKCSKNKDIQDWAKGKTRHLIRNCPKCKVLIEKGDGCSEVICSCC